MAKLRRISTVILLIFIPVMILSEPVFSSTGRTPEIAAADLDNTDFIYYKCPFFPDGYALPRDVMIKFFALRSDLSVGKVKSLTFTIETNREAENITYRLYKGIPKNPFAVFFDIEPTATAKGDLRNNTKIVFDSLDATVIPGYSESFLLKIDDDQLSNPDNS